MLGVLVLVLITAATPGIRAEDPTPMPGQLSVAAGPTAALNPAAATPTATPGERFIAVSSGEYHTCALRADGEPVCWGAEPVDPEAGLDPVDFGQASPPDDERFVGISSGGFHTCGLREDGTAVCWGAALDDQSERHGQVGFGQSSPPDGEVFASISSGGFHTCGLREDGTAVCWGNDENGQSAPPDNERFTVLSSGGNHTCALREDRQAVCWGPEPYAADFRRMGRSARRPVRRAGQHLGTNMRPAPKRHDGLLGGVVGRGL